MEIIANKNRRGLLEYIKDTSFYINTAIDSINDTNDSMLSVIDKSISAANRAVENIKIIANKLADAIVIDGKLASTVNIFSDEVKSDSVNTVLDNDSLSIYLDQSDEKVLVVKNMSITGNNIGSIKAEDVISGDGVVISNDRAYLSVTVDIELDKEDIISALDVHVEDDGTIFPTVVSAIGIRANGKIEKIQFARTRSDSVQISKELERLLISPAAYKKIRFTILKNDSSLTDRVSTSIILNKINIVSMDSFKTGSIVFGPVKDNISIKKIAVDFIEQQSKYSNIKVFISTDNKTWIETSRSNRDNLSQKVFNINNIDKDSYFFEQEVRSFYVKFEISALESTANIKAIPDIFIATDVSTNYTEQAYGSDYAVYQVDMATGNGYGRIVLEQNDESVVIGTRNEKPFTDYKKLEIDSNTMVVAESFIEQDIAIYGISTPVLTEVGEGYTESACLVPIVPHGVYRIQISGASTYIDMSHGVIGSIDRFNIEATQESIAYVYNAIGELIGTVTATSIEDKYIISMHDLFFGINNDTSFNKYYPIITPANTYSISGYRVVYSGHPTTSININKIKEERIRSIEVSKQSGRIKSEVLKTGKWEGLLSEEAFKKKVKLKHCNLINGSISINDNNAYVSSIRKEVGFIDGKTEFSAKEYKSISVIGSPNMSNIIDMDAYGVEVKNNEQMDVSGETNLFTNLVTSENELINEGDYFVNDNKIYLPEGVFLSAYIETTLSFSAVSNTYNSGLFSVDYRNGILYSNTPIDSATIIKYQYSLMFASFIETKRVTEGYIDTGSSIIIHGDDGRYYLKLEAKDKSMKKINTSPIIKNINIYYTV